MEKTALIFGAGKTGRGFAAHLAFLGGYRIILIDKNKQLISDLRKCGRYDIQVLNNEKRNCTINLSGAYHIEDVSWHPYFVETGLAFTAVFGNNLQQLGDSLASALQKRHAEHPDRYLTIITCENSTNAATLLKETALKHLDADKRKWLSEYVGFSESIILSTCLDANAAQSPLTVRCEDFFELPCDADAIKTNPGIHGLKPLRQFRNQLRRKIYTYNCINAVITYLGARKGYTQLHEAADDAEILEFAKKAANETSLAQIAEFGFATDEQEKWVNAALAKFANKNIPDPIQRNAADPARKLGRDDRLIGPALLALKHGIYPEALLEAILACFDYSDPDQNFALRDVIRKEGPDFLLREICGLSVEEELFKLIRGRIAKK